MKENRRQMVYTGIDLGKLIAAILVVILHTVETTNYYACEVKFVLTRFAVPFFFIASGFFFYKGLEKAVNKKEYFYKYEKNILKLFLIWGVLIYSPFTIIEYVQNNPSVGLLRIVLLLIRRIFIIGSGPYWYLVALMWSAAFLYLCYVCKKDILAKIMIIVGLILGILYASFRGVLSEILVFKYIFDIIYFIFSWEFNFVTYGIPFMGIGFLVAKYKMKLSLKKASCIFVIATMIRMVEYNLRQWFFDEIFWEENEISFMFIIQAISFFFIMKEITFDISKEKSLLIRQMSSFVYFVHVIILYNILNPLLEKYTIWPIYGPEFVLIKVMIVLSICGILFAIIKKIDNEKLNILING